MEISINNIVYKFATPNIAVSKCGSILFNLKPHTPYKRPDGYLSIGQKLLHRLVATCWLENPNNSAHVHHIDGNKSNNNVENLEWVSPKIHNAVKHKGSHGHYVRTNTTRQKLRELRTGTKQSEETKSKISSSVKEHFQNPDNFKKYREALKTRRHGKIENPKIAELKRTPCIIFGVKYNSLKEASTATGIKWGTIRRRLLSKNFPDYHY